jgi:uncharacterized protein YjeT (DUF2065 family)
MTPLQWIALALGLLIVVTRVPIVHVMVVLALLFAGVGVAPLLFPESFQRFVEQIWSGVPPRVVRVAGGVGVAFGIWLVYLSLSG